MSLVTVMTDATSNAELIAQAAQLGYLRDDWVTLDPTWGLGNFWTIWRPLALVGTDIDPTKSRTKTSIDFRALPWPDRYFDAVVFDPPYQLNGTSTGKGPSAKDPAYGVTKYQSVADRHQMICDGTTECVRVLNRGGMLLVKCQDQVSGGRKRWQTREFADHAEQLGCRLVDMLHLPGMRDQPTDDTKQQHARQNFSTLLVLKKGTR